VNANHAVTSTDELGRAGARRRTAARRAGFSLPEMLVAIIIGATLVTAAVTFALSMGELWGFGAETRLFDQHVRGVTRFLENLLRQAVPPPGEQQAGLDQRATAVAEDVVAWRVPGGRAYGTEELLTFEVPESPGVFAWPEEPLPFVVCSLRVDPRDGLFLLWKSRLEVDFDDADPREMRISPFVTAISYFYFDDDEDNPQWEQLDQPRRTSARDLEVPDRIRLRFEYDGDVREVDIIMPGAMAGAGVPIY